MFNERVDKEKEAARLQKQAEEHDLLMQTQKKLKEMQITHEINTKIKDKGLTATQQASYILDNTLNPMMNELNEKAQIINTIQSLIRTHSSVWNAFINTNTSIPGILDNYQDASIKDLNNILQGFQSVINTPNINIFPNQPQLTMNNPIVQKSNDDDEYDNFNET